MGNGRVVIAEFGSKWAKKRKPENQFAVSEKKEGVAGEQKSSQNLCMQQTHKIGEEPIK